MTMQFLIAKAECCCCHIGGSQCEEHGFQQYFRLRNEIFRMPGVEKACEEFMKAIAKGIKIADSAEDN